MSRSSIIMDDSLIIRSGEEAVPVKFRIEPAQDKQGFWVNCTPELNVSVKYYDQIQNERILSVSGINNANTAAKGFVKIILDNGVEAECEVTVLPSVSEPPKFAKTPEIIFTDGKAVIDYDFMDMEGNVDQSEINWYRVDKIDRSNFDIIKLSKKSNETDGRKVAVSRNDIPCKEIRLTSADIGKHIKANIKPKHDNSEKGQGLNIMSRIVKPSDVNEQLIVMNPQTAVISPDYDIEPGYFTARGTITAGVSFSVPHRPALLPENMGSGFYYNKENEVDNMSLVAILEPECADGNGFLGPRQYMDIYVKYDPVEQNGYALRIEGTAAEDGKALFCLYQIKNGNSTPVSDEYLSDAFKPGCEVSLEVRDDILNVFVSYDDGEEFSDLELRAKIRPNYYGGFGFKYMAEPENGYRCAVKFMEATYLE